MGINANRVHFIPIHFNSIYISNFGIFQIDYNEKNVITIELNHIRTDLDAD